MFDLSLTDIFNRQVREKKYIFMQRNWGYGNFIIYYHFTAASYSSKSVNGQSVFQCTMQSWFVFGGFYLVLDLVWDVLLITLPIHNWKVCIK